jgi:hypothetical protein
MYAVPYYSNTSVYSTAVYEPDYDSLSSFCSSNEEIDLVGVPLYPSPNVTYSPHLLSRKYGLFADYTTPLYPQNYLPQPQMAQTFNVNPLYIPGARIISDVIEVAQPEILSDRIEFVGDESNYENVPYLLNTYPSTKRLTRIIRYKKSDTSYDVDDESDLSESEEAKRSEDEIEEVKEKKEKKEKSHRKKKSHHKKSSKDSKTEESA